MPPPLSRILVIGSTGFIGTHFLHLLAREKPFEHVRILVRNNTGSKKVSKIKKIIPQAEITKGDLRDLPSLNNSIKDCDVVVNIGGKADYAHSKELYDVNVNGVENLCKAASSHKISKLIHVSSTASLGYSENINDLKDENSDFELAGRGYHYAESKYKGDVICLKYFKEHGLPAVICMPSEVYGEEGMETARNLRDLIRFPVAWNGGTSVVYVKDVVKGLLEAIKAGRPGEKYILGSENMTISDILSKSLKIAGREARIFRIPNFILNYPVRYISLIQEKIKTEPVFDPHVITYATKYWFVSSEKAMRDLNFSPVSSDVMLDRTIGWLSRENLL